ncbi:MAG: O-antigen ligase family protein, partial [Gammaproteobacteria bacterium]|nr:O-antigen ligase family protein [Gammaproteobacteria bacterium]
MKVLAIWILTFAVSFISIKDWHKGVCVLIAFTGIYSHALMPTNTLGVQGLNPWNLILIFTLLGFIFRDKSDERKAALGGGVLILVLLYISISQLSSIRLLFDFESLSYWGRSDTIVQIVSDRMINRFKWIIPGVLVFLGAYSYESQRHTLLAILIAYILIGVVVVSRVPIGSVLSDLDFNRHSLKVLEQAFGWSRVNTAMMLSGGAWLSLIIGPKVFPQRFKYVNIVIFAFLTFALALTGGRAGYLAWAVLGLFLTIYKWRKGILVIPIFIIAVVTFMPFVVDRVLSGIDSDSANMEVSDVDAATSGRAIAWPVVIDKIKESPWLGYGGMAMIRTGAYEEVRKIQNLSKDDRGFPHPHNAYLRLLLDAGLLGAAPLLLFWVIALRQGFKLSGRKRSAPDQLVGLTFLIIFLSLLVTGISSQDFYPTQG